MPNLERERLAYAEGVSPPPLLNHRCLPLFARPQHFLLRPTHAGLHSLRLRTDQQTHFPAELVRVEGRACLPAILSQAEQVAEFLRIAVPSETETLKNVQSISPGEAGRALRRREALTKLFAHGGC